MAIKKRSATVVPGASGAAAAIKNPPASRNSFWGELPQHVMSGISRMVPTLIMGGVILAFSQLIAYSWLDIPADTGIMDALNSGKFSGFNLSLLKFAWLSQSFGGVLFGFAIPMFAAFVANSIGGKLAFPAGFIGGLMSTQPTQILNFDPATLQWATSTPVPSTFIGALIISIVAGYLVKWMNQKIQLPDFLLAFKTTFLLPHSFRDLRHAGDVLRDNAVWRLDQRRNSHSADGGWRERHADVRDGDFCGNGD
ncbi:fructose-like specific PTS system EIIC component 1 [Citrobacter freundii]|nr:fructose-like specific PTS system EIIC component 1 [Citrobacter freundii]